MSYSVNDGGVCRAATGFTRSAKYSLDNKITTIVTVCHIKKNTVMCHSRLLCKDQDNRKKFQKRKRKKNIYLYLEVC